MFQSTIQKLFLLGLSLWLFGGSAFCQDQGLQFIGFSKSTERDLQYVRNAFKNHGGDLQLGFLPFEFNPNKPFDRARNLVFDLFPEFNGTLEIAVFGKWFPHDSIGNVSQHEFWEAWRTSTPNRTQKEIRARYRKRVDKFIRWAGIVQSYVAMFGQEHQFEVTFVPVLEDICLQSQRAGFERLLDMVYRKTNNAGISLNIRRSCLIPFVFRVDDHPIELHGTWNEVRPFLRQGDVWSNDGTNYTLSAFLRDQDRALSRGVDVLLWRQRYNGHPRTRDNWAERTVDPFKSKNQRQFANTVLKN